jgi:hypothetical protein
VRWAVFPVALAAYHWQTFTVDAASTRHADGGIAEMTRHNIAARAALVAAAALAISGCDMINSAEAAKGAEAGSGASTGAGIGAGAGAGAGAPTTPPPPASNVDPLLASPQVGDVWAANLDHFSAVEFGDPGGPDVFGLVRVVNVTDSQVTIITETSSSPDASTASGRLSDLSNVTWDEQERIPINRSDFEALVRDQRIVRPIRPAGGAPAGGSSSGGDYNAGGSAAPAAPNAPAPGGGK